MRRLVVFFLCYFVWLFLPRQFVVAAGLTALSDRMTRQTISVASNHDIRTGFSSGINSAGDTITVTFASGFDLTTLVAADIGLSHGAVTGEETVETIQAAALPSSPGIWEVAISGQIITLSPPADAGVGEIASADHVIIRIGTNVSGGTHQILNPGVAGGYIVSIGGGFGGSGGMRLPIGTGGQTTAVSGTVPSTPVVSPPTSGGGGGGGVGGPSASPTPVVTPLPTLVITDNRVVDITADHATILWSTNASASGWVEYGLLPGVYPSRVLTSGVGVFQTVLLSGLLPSTTYRARIHASASSGREASSAEMTFTTTARAASPATPPAVTPPPVSPPPTTTPPTSPTPAPTPATTPTPSTTPPPASPTSPTATPPTSAPSGAGTVSGTGTTPSAPIGGSATPAPSDASGSGGGATGGDGTPIIPTSPSEIPTEFPSGSTDGMVPLVPTTESSASSSVSSTPVIVGSVRATSTKPTFNNPLKSIKKEASVLANATALAESLRENVAASLDVIRTPETEAVAQVAAPVAIATAVATVTTAASAATVFNYLYLLLTQPLLLLQRRKRDKWGLVYNSLSKQPVDLAVVRLVHAVSGAIVQTRITDALGRFAFLAPPGSYRLQVAKANFTYPSELLKNDKVDVDFVDLYHGEIINVVKSASITPNIPVDPLEKTVTPKEILRKQLWRRIQHGLSLGSAVISIGALVIHPSWLMAGLSVVQLAVYALFRRLSLPPKPKNWGIVYDQSTQKKVGHAVVRIFDKRFHKLLETQITDKDGKYAFFAGKNVYFVTADHPEYERFTSPEIDVQKEAFAVIDPTLHLTPKAATQTPVVTS